MTLRHSALTLACTLLLAMPARAQQAYPTAAAAADALVAALEARDQAPQHLATVLGADWEQYVPRNSVEREDVEAFIRQYRQKHAIKAGGAGEALLTVGSDGWTLPVPLTRQANGWGFDLRAAEPELRARRIGRNEREAVQAVLAYADAQREYARRDRNDDTLPEYAKRLRSSEGTHDGLYWPADSAGESPLGPLFGGETPDGEWHGYHYRILLGQGPSAPRGAYPYEVAGHLSRGFALIAWPARYGDSGVMSYTISHAGHVYEKDLGPDTDQQARGMTLFDPDSSWTQVPDR
ncbi:DUF2950 domain-containing protein [Paracidovorax citrulli]